VTIRQRVAWTLSVGAFVALWLVAFGWSVLELARKGFG
jgi:hypothetical protein